MGYTVTITAYDTHEHVRRAFGQLTDALDLVADVYGTRVDLADVIVDVRTGTGYVALIGGTCLTVTATQH